MKKSIFWIYIFFIHFLLISCNEESNSISQSTDCGEEACILSLNNFLINLSISMNPYDNENIDEISDFENYFGILDGATDGYDSEYDILEPPSGVGNWINLYFPHPEWNHNLGDNFTQDIRDSILLNQQDRTITWDFNIESNASGTATLNFNIFENYCYNCIESIELDVDGNTYLIPLYEINQLDILISIESYNIVSCSLVVTFLDFDSI